MDTVCAHRQVRWPSRYVAVQARPYGDFEELVYREYRWQQGEQQLPSVFDLSQRQRRHRHQHGTCHQNRPSSRST